MSGRCQYLGQPEAESINTQSGKYQYPKRYFKNIFFRFRCLCFILCLEAAMTETHLKKPSAMIQTNAKGLTANQRKLLNALILITQKQGDGYVQQTTLDEIKRLCAIRSTENMVLKEQLKELASTVVEFNYLKKDKVQEWHYYHLLAEVVVEFGTGNVRFAFAPSITDNIIRPAVYAALDVITVAQLKSSYSIVLYELLRDYSKSPALPVIAIDDLRDLFGLTPEQYPKFYDFRRYVLNVAVEEINECTELNCSYRLFRRPGQKVYGRIKFLLSVKSSEELARELEDLLKFIPLESRNSDRLREALVEKPELSFEEKLSCIRYTNANSRRNYEAYLLKALKKDWGQLVRKEDEKLFQRHEHELQEALLRLNESNKDIPLNLRRSLLLEALRSFPLALSPKLITAPLVVDVACNIWSELQKGST